ncbi:MAG: hypothetical protein M3Z22_07980 [Verrucomicrobiota bacterium]|nr:hypothetical protein [Verrucomicrobiota bacterium]
MAHVISYSHITTASIPNEVWDEAWFTIQSWKGFLQSFPGILAIRPAARALDDGDIRFQIHLVWEHPEQMEVWLKSQWASDVLLTSLNPPAYDVVGIAYEDLG